MRCSCKVLTLRSHPEHHSAVSSISTWRKHGSQWNLWYLLATQRSKLDAAQRSKAQKLLIFVLSATFQTFDKYTANTSRFRTWAASETERSHLLWNYFYAKQIDGSGQNELHTRASMLRSPLHRCINDVLVTWCFIGNHNLHGSPLVIIPSVSGCTELTPAAEQLWYGRQNLNIDISQEKLSLSMTPFQQHELFSVIHNR